MEEQMQESLGEFLKRNREEKNISIEQMAYSTRISQKMLRALEDNDHSVLPAGTFVRGYLQAYAKCARMDAQDLMLRYQHHLAMDSGAKKASLKSHYLYVKERYQEKKRLLLIISLFAALAFSGAAYLMLKVKRGRGKQIAQQVEQLQNTTPITPIRTDDKNGSGATGAITATITINTPNSAPVVATPTAIAPSAKLETKPEAKAVAEKTKEENDEVEDQVDDKESPAPVVANKKYNLALTTEQEVWLRFQTDTDPVKDIMLHPGKKIFLRADTVIKIFSGNLAALHAVLNGQELSKLATEARSKSAVLPESEIAHYPPPLFPELQKKDEEAREKEEMASPAPDATPPEAPKTSSDN